MKKPKLIYQLDFTPVKFDRMGTIENNVFTPINEPSFNRVAKQCGDNWFKRSPHNKPKRKKE